MRYKVIFQKAAEKFLKKQTARTQQRLLSAIYQLPKGSDIKKLCGRNTYRLRVGNMRVLYTIDDTIKIISIENIKPRGDVYKKL